MPLRPDARALLDEFARQGARPYDELGVLRARRGIENAVAVQGERVAVASVRDVLVDGADGLLPARVYTPGTAGPVLLVYLHGGGWALGSVALADRPCRALAAATGSVVVSVEYRRAPETPYPGPLEDALAATAWCVGHAPALGADPDRVVVIGDSAGGNLAAGVALLARDRGGLGPDARPLAGQVLLYPVLDRDGGHPSLAENATGLGLHRSEIDWYWSMYHPGADLPPTAAPLRADPAGTAPALVVTAQYDPLRDEGDAYAAALAAAGVPTTAVTFPGTIHGFLWFGGVLGSTAALLALLADAVPALLARAGRMVP